MSRNKQVVHDTDSGRRAKSASRTNPDPAEGQYGPGRDTSNDPPILWDGESEVPGGWRCTAYEDKKLDKKPESKPEKPRNPWGTPGSWRS